MERKEEAEKQILSPKSAINMMEEQFWAFAKFEYPEGKEGMSIPNMRTWLERADLFTEEIIDEEQLQLAFDEVAWKHTRFSFDKFNSFLDHLSKITTQDKEYLLRKLAKATVPKEKAATSLKRSRKMEVQFWAFAKFDDPEGWDGLSKPNMRIWLESADMFSEEYPGAGRIGNETLDEAFEKVSGTYPRMSFKGFVESMHIFSDITLKDEEQLVEQLFTATVPSNKAATSPKYPRNMMKVQFSAFSNYYDPEGRDGISLPNIKLWFERADIRSFFLQEKEFQRAFDEVAGKHSRLSFDAFETFLKLLSKVIGADEEQWVTRLAMATVPRDEADAGVEAGAAGAGSNTLESEKDSASSSVTGGGAGASGAGGKIEKE